MGARSPQVSNEPDMDDRELSADGAELIRQLQERRGSRCRVCGRPLVLHQILASMAFGAGSAPHCLECLAAALEQSPNSLEESLSSYFEARACYREAWKWASQTEGVEVDKSPGCLTGH